TARHQPQTRAFAARGRAKNAQRLDSGASAGHSGIGGVGKDRRRPHGNRPDPGPDHQDRAPVQAPKTRRQRGRRIAPFPSSPSILEGGPKREFFTLFSGLSSKPEALQKAKGNA